MSARQETYHTFIVLIIFFSDGRGRRGRDRMVFGFKVSITTKIVSSNSVHDNVCSIQHDVIKFVSDLLLLFSIFSGFFANKNDHSYITEILLEVALNTITITLFKDA